MTATHPDTARPRNPMELNHPNYRPKKPGWVQMMPGGKKVRCQATARSGNQCQLAVVPGAQVCKWHGGAAPQTRRRAAIRLQEMVNPALAMLAREVTNMQTGTPMSRIRAVENVLDRAGFGRSVEVTGDDARQQLIERLQGMVEQQAQQQPAPLPVLDAEIVQEDD